MPSESIETQDVEDEELTTLDAANYHAPLLGSHSHDHSHGPGDASHSHAHNHNNSNSHLHDHTGNLDGDGGQPDGDGDQDDWNEPRAATASGSGVNSSIPTPNDAQSNPGRANNADNNDSTGRANKSFDPSLLLAYNGLGKTLGFAAVDPQGNRADGVTLEGDNSIAFRDYLVALREAGTHLVHSADYIALRLGVEVPALPAGSPAPVTPVVETPPPAPIQVITMPNTPPDVADIQRQLTNANNELLTLNQQIGALKGNGLGRPTTFAGRSPLSGFNGDKPVHIEAQTPEQLRTNTAIQKRGDGVKCRLWPYGHGIHQRPQLSNDQMSIMSIQDMDNYYQGREVLVPIIHEGD